MLIAMDNISPIGAIFINLFIIGTIIFLIVLAMNYGFPFVLGFVIATLIYQIGYRAKHGEWYSDS
jgi:hypothetical protein